jgi:hypothetical protein
MSTADSSAVEGDAAVEADEMYQNAGEKGISHPDPDDPPGDAPINVEATATSPTTGPRWLE